MIYRNKGTGHGTKNHIFPLRATAAIRRTSGSVQIVRVSRLLLIDERWLMRMMQAQRMGPRSLIVPTGRMSCLRVAARSHVLPS